MSERFSLFVFISALCALWIVQMAGQTPAREVQVEHTVTMQKGETQEQLQQRAEIEAALKAVRDANGLEVKGYTAVFNNQVVTDLTQAYADGLLLGYTVVEGRFEPHQAGGFPLLNYTVRLKAQVAPPRAVRRDPAFDAEILLDRTTFVDGDALRIRLRVTKDCYVYLFNVGADQAVTALIPNRYHPDNFLRAGVEFVFPSAEEESSGFRLRAVLPENTPSAEERLTVIATRENIDLIGQDFKEAFRVFDGRETGLMTQLSQKLNRLKDVDWVQDIAAYTIVKRK